MTSNENNQNKINIDILIYNKLNELYNTELDNMSKPNELNNLLLYIKLKNEISSRFPLLSIDGFIFALTHEPNIHEPNNLIDYLTFLELVREKQNELKELNQEIIELNNKKKKFILDEYDLFLIDNFINQIHKKISIKENNMKFFEKTSTLIIYVPKIIENIRKSIGTENKMLINKIRRKILNLKGNEKIIQQILFAVNDYRNSIKENEHIAYINYLNTKIRIPSQNPFDLLNEERTRLNKQIKISNDILTHITIINNINNNKKDSYKEDIITLHKEIEEEEPTIYKYLTGIMQKKIGIYDLNELANLTITALEKLRKQLDEENDKNMASIELIINEINSKYKPDAIKQSNILNFSNPQHIKYLYNLLESIIPDNIFEIIKTEQEQDKEEGFIEMRKIQEISNEDDKQSKCSDKTNDTSNFDDTSSTFDDNLFSEKLPLESESSLSFIKQDKIPISDINEQDAIDINGQDAISIDGDIKSNSDLERNFEKSQVSCNKQDEMSGISIKSNSDLERNFEKSQVSFNEKEENKDNLNEFEETRSTLSEKTNNTFKLYEWFTDIENNTPKNNTPKIDLRALCKERQYEKRELALWEKWEYEKTNHQDEYNESIDFGFNNDNNANNAFKKKPANFKKQPTTTEDVLSKQSKEMKEMADILERTLNLNIWSETKTLLSNNEYGCTLSILDSIERVAITPEELQEEIKELPETEIEEIKKDLISRDFDLETIQKLMKTNKIPEEKKEQEEEQLSGEQIEENNNRRSIVINKLSILMILINDYLYEKRILGPNDKKDPLILYTKEIISKEIADENNINKSFNKTKSTDHQ